MSGDHAKHKGVIAHHDPSVIFVEDAAPFASALAALANGARLVTSAPHDGARRFAEDAPVNEPVLATFYGGAAEGHTDYPLLGDRA